MSPMTSMLKNRKMKNKIVIYLAKGEKESSALLKSRAVQDYFGTNDVILELSEKGKPIITSPKGYGISIAHSGGVWAAVIAPFNVGIDIEERNNKDNSAVARGFFHESEVYADFYDTWVRKEACGKLSGDGVFALRGKKLDSSISFVDISEQISEFAKKKFSAVIVAEQQIDSDFDLIGISL